MHFPPFLFVVIRQLLAGSILLSLVFFFRNTKLPSRSQLFQQSIAGFFMITLGNGLVAWAEVVIPSGIAAIICSTMPLMTLIFNFSLRIDSPQWKSVLGIVLGFAGIMVIFQDNLNEFIQPRYFAGIMVLLVSVASWSGASIWSKRRATGDPFMNSGLQMLFGGLWLIPASLIFDQYDQITLGTEVMWAMGYLVIFGSIIAYASFGYALKNLPITLVSLYAYVNPVVAVLLGWLLLSEKVDFSILIGCAIILCGIYFVNQTYYRKSLPEST